MTTSGSSLDTAATSASGAGAVERDGLFSDRHPDAAGRRRLPITVSSVGFAHWSFEPEAVTRLLPEGRHADLYGGRAWVGYQFMTVTVGRTSSYRLPSARLSQWLTDRSRFREMRLGVLVVDDRGRPGVHLLSIDVDRRAVVRSHRRFLNLPAFHAEIHVSTNVPDVVDYRSARSDGTTARIMMRIGSAVADTDVDRFLTARWRILLPSRFWVDGDDQRSITATHEPWPLQRASVLAVDDDALVAAGLPTPDQPARALWSPGLAVDVNPAANG